MESYYMIMQAGSTANIDIYGDIVSDSGWFSRESDCSSYQLVKEIEEFEDVDVIYVNINSYGGEVKEGLAIANALKRHPAKVVTRCDGFACSIASVVFMAGDERVMHGPSLLMIHNALYSWTSGNANELRKQAEDLDVITDACKHAYLERINIDEEELTTLMDAETWISAADALSMGFATKVEDYSKDAHPTQRARASISRHILHELGLPGTVLAAQEDPGITGAGDPPGEGDAKQPGPDESGDGDLVDEESPGIVTDEADAQIDEGAVSAFFDAAFKEGR